MAASTSPGEQGAAFSLIELIVVVGILGLLLALVAPAIISTKAHAKTQQARMEMTQIAFALKEYEAVYGRFPISTEALQAATLKNEDLTYGGVIEETHTWLAGPSFLTNNAELMAGLLDLEYYGDSAPTINLGHVQNPQRRRFLNVRMQSLTNAAPGVGMDGVYRDPWGSPYLVTLDLNGDGRARDVLYREPIVAQDPAAPDHGLVGLRKATNAQGQTVFEALGTILIWSAGPDRRISTQQKANEGFNRDNILLTTP